VLEQTDVGQGRDAQLRYLPTGVARGHSHLADPQLDCQQAVGFPPVTSQAVDEQAVDERAVDCVGRVVGPSRSRRSCVRGASSRTTPSGSAGRTMAPRPRMCGPTRRDDRPEAVSSRL